MDFNERNALCSVVGIINLIQWISTKVMRCVDLMEGVSVDDLKFFGVFFWIRSSTFFCVTS